MSDIRFKSYYIAVVLFSALLTVVSCSTRTVQKPVITVSIQPQKYLLEQIVGDKIDVRCLLANGGNPENYEPSLTHLMNLEGSEAYFQIGNIGFESAIIDRIRNNNPDLKIFNTSDSIMLIIGTHGECTAHGHSHEVDPHTWSSVRNGKIIAANMYKAMINMDPANEKTYTKNYSRLVAHLDSLDSRIDSMLSGRQGSAFMVWHPSLSYFARDYGLEQISIGVEGKEASVQRIQSKIDDAKRHNAKIFFAQKDFDSRQASVISREIGAKIIDINPLNYQWEDELYGVAVALASE